MKFANRIANWLLVVAAVLAVAVFSLRLMPDRSRGAPELEVIGAGAQMPAIQGISYEERDSILFFLSSACTYCRASSPLYREVLETVKNSAIAWQAYAISADTEPMFASYLERETLEFDRVITDAQLIRGFPVVPIVALVSRAGTVTAVWAGQLSPDDETDLLAALRATPTG